MVRDRIYPEDLAKVLEAGERAIQRKIDQEVDFRIVLPDGSLRYVHLAGHTAVVASGSVIETTGTVMDITAQQEAATALDRAFDEIKKLKDQLYKENLALKAEIDRSWMFEEIVGASAGLQTVLTRVSKVASADSTVLITGETGTGKELIAHAIHKQSPRSSRAFVNVDCAAIPPSLIASELFGHEKGAFTGATQRRMGRFELADGGTIFLDEVGELPVETQVALLRVLQEHRFERVGGVQTIRSDVQVIAASNRNLHLAIARGSFRSDLFYRLNVFPIEVPPLRDRTEDLLLLIDYFVKRFAKRLGKKIRSVDAKTLELLQSYTWPGNIRELQNVIERSIILSDTDKLLVEEIWLTPSSYEATFSGQPLPSNLLRSEKEIIEAALAETRGRVAGSSGAAAKLQIPPSTLESKIRSLKINKYWFKSDPAK
jgi:transcriptional regulator with GAF, ATPase, and Fis domain